jgi:hypothetical protein
MIYIASLWQYGILRHQVVIPSRTYTFKENKYIYRLIPATCFGLISHFKDSIEFYKEDPRTYMLLVWNLLVALSDEHVVQGTNVSQKVNR